MHISIRFFSFFVLFLSINVKQRDSDTFCILTTLRCDIKTHFLYPEDYLVALIFAVFFSVDALASPLSRFLLVKQASILAARFVSPLERILHFLEVLVDSVYNSRYSFPRKSA
jgi:hypothetical protein